MSVWLWFVAGAWVMGLVWLVVEMAAKRLREARGGSAAFPAEQLETITERALRAMLLESFKTQQQGLERGDQ